MKMISIDAVVTEIFKAEMYNNLTTFCKIAWITAQLYLELPVFHVKNYLLCL